MADDSGSDSDGDGPDQIDEVVRSNNFKGKTVLLSPAERSMFASALVGHSITPVGCDAILHQRGFTVGDQNRSCFAWQSSCARAPQAAARRTYTAAHCEVSYHTLSPSTQAQLGPALNDDLVATVECFYECVLAGKTMTAVRVRLFGPKALTHDPLTGLTVIIDRKSYVIVHLAARRLGKVVALGPGAPGIIPENSNHRTVIRHLGKFTDY